MNMIQEMHDSGKITDGEMDKLSSIRDGFIRAMDDGASGVMSFIRDEFGECTDDELNKISSMVDAIRMNVMSECDDTDDFVFSSILCDEALEKVSSIADAGEFLGRGAFGTATRGALAAAAVGTVGLHLLNSIAQGVKLIKHPFQEASDRVNTDRKSEIVLSSILKQNPGLKADKRTFENFGVLKTYAPQTVAINKPLAESMLKKMQQWGHVDPQALSQMIKMEKDHLYNVQAKSMIPETTPVSMKLGPDLLGAMV